MAINWRVRGSSGGDEQQVVWEDHLVSHINKDGHYVHELKFGNTIVWEEYCGTYSRGTLPAGVASLSCTRTTKEPSIASGTISTDNTEVFNGDVLTFSATASAYWTASLHTTSYTIESNPDELSRESTFYGVTLSGVSASRTMRTITITKNANISSITVTYTNSSGTRTTATRTSSGTISAWEGATVTWTATAATGYTASQSSGSFAIGSGAQTIAPTARLTLSWQTLPAFASASSSAKSLSWASGTSGWSSETTSKSLYLEYDFLRPHSEVRISGSATIVNKTVSFTNIEINTESTTFTNVATINVDVSGVSSTFVLQAHNYNSDRILFKVIRSSGSVTRPAVSLTLTSVQINAYDSSMTLSAPSVSVPSGDMYVRATNPNGVKAYIYVEGSIYWTSAVVDTDSGDYTWLGAAADANGYYDVGSEDIDGIPDESLDWADARIVLAADHYLNPSASTQFDL